MLCGLFIELAPCIGLERQQSGAGIHLELP
jgi:hypothetical protein